MNPTIHKAVDGGVRIHLVPELGVLNAEIFPVPRLRKVAWASNSESPLHKKRNILFKRGFDLVFSSGVILLILSWMVPLLWLINRLFYRQSVFFIQKRNGLNGRVFSCIKFKSMIDSDEADLRNAAVNDPRITPLGRILRKTGMDELPQFMNVFAGQMSVIGPRPHMLFHTDFYSNLIPEFMRRHTVKPGLTGLAQVSGYRGSIHTLMHLKQRVSFDLLYIKNWSIRMEIKIFFLTIFSIFNAERMPSDYISNA